jgi:beta-galactosidase
MMARIRQRFDQSWKFYKGDIPMFEAVKAGMLGGLSDVQKREGKDNVYYQDKEHHFEIKPKDWQDVTLPHDWCVEEDHTFSKDEVQCSHGYLPRGVGFYRKVFDLPANLRDGKISLMFDGIFRNSTLWLNGHLLRQHRSGYTSFEMDITEVARCGKEGSNCLLIRVDAREAEGWWYEGCGIYRHVWLCATDRLHVGTWGSYVTTPSVSPSRAAVKVETTLVNKRFEGARAVVRTDLLLRGKTVASRQEPLDLEAGQTRVLQQEFSVPRPELWSPETPALYQAVTSVRVAGKEIDRYQTTFGIRSIAFDAEKGFLLNGKPYLLKGTCNHQDFAGVGVALPDSLHEFKIKKLKEMGSNAYRCSHHPPAPELLEACDRLGMLVMDENRKLDASKTGLEDLKSMLYRDRNHPSIILWSMENEERLEGSEVGARILRTLAQTTRAIDPTRPTTAAMNHGYDKGDYSFQVDVVGFNYGHNEGNKDVAYHRRHPSHKLVGSENNSTTTTRGIFEKDEKRGYVPSDGTVLESWCCDMEKAWNDVLEHPFLAGVFVWTGFDYRGEPTPYQWPCVNSHFGLMDTCGFYKGTGLYHQAIWSAAPVLHLMQHWNWEGKEGEAIPVWAFCNQDEVELVLNGRSLGRKRVVQARHLEWAVPYEKGTLVAKAYARGKLVLTKVVKTAGAPASVLLEPDRDKIRADGVDAVPVRVSILDKDGNICPKAGNLVKFSVKGPGQIIGVGNGDPSSHERDKAQQRRAFNGLCLAIVQNSGKRGALRLTATSAGLKKAEVVLGAR